jgi:hypothetical protein
MRFVGTAVACLFNWNGLKGNKCFCSLQLTSIVHGLWHTLFPIRFVLGMTFKLSTPNYNILLMYTWTNVA